MRSLPLLFLLAMAGIAPIWAEAVQMKSGERYIGEVTDLGDSIKIVTPSRPQGLVVKKTDIQRIYPKPEELLTGVRDSMEKARDLYAQGKKASDPNPDMKAAIGLLFDLEAEMMEVVDIYPANKADFMQVRTDIHQWVILCRQGQKVDGSGPPSPKEKDQEPPPDPRPKEESGPPTSEPPAAKKTTGKPTTSAYLLYPPQGTTANDLERARKIMLARLKDHGYEGVEFDAIQQDGVACLHYSCTQELTDEMKNRIVWYAARPGAKLELRLIVTMTEAQKEQFAKPSPEELSTATAPKGAKWYRYGSADTILLSDKGVIARKEFADAPITRQGKLCYELSNPAASAIRGDPGLEFKNNRSNGIAFLMDGIAFRVKETVLELEGEHDVKVQGDEKLGVGIIDTGLKRGKARLVKAPGVKVWLYPGYMAQDWTPIRILGERPLPFPLKTGE